MKIKVSIRTKNLELTQGLRSFVEEKIGEVLDRLLSREKTPLEANVELIRVTWHHQKGKVFRAEVQVRLHGHKIISEAGGESIEEAIDQVKNELEREIKSHRGKETTLRRKGARFLKKLLHLSPLARFKRRS